jgi:hypothetical protein
MKKPPTFGRLAAKSVTNKNKGVSTNKYKQLL